MKTLQGTIVSNKMQNTVTVLVARLWQDPVYKKRLKRSIKVLAHTDQKLKEGQEVIITEIKPMSKRKNWQVTEVIKK
jgi:small subunit ribosomal protein S17